MSKIFTKINVLLVICLLTFGFFSSCEEEETLPNGGKVALVSFGPSGIKHGEEIKFIGYNLDKVSSIVLPGVEVPSSEFASQSSDLITLVVPEAAEAGKVVLKTSDGDIESKTMLNFLVPVTIESITPEARPGSNITIKGDKLNWIEEVVFSSGHSVTEFVSQSLNELVVTVPMEAQTGQLIFKSGGTEPLSFASEGELVVTVPTVTALTPASIRHQENLTISGTNLDLINAVVFGEDTVSTFESQTAEQLVVTVPATATKGVLTLLQASPVNVVTAEELSIILPVGTELTPSPAVPGKDNITIKGTNLDLIASLKLPGVADPVPASSFVSQTAEEIVLALPEGAAAGSISYTTVHGYSNSLGVILIVPGEGPKPLLITLYDDEMAPGGGDWSWEKVISDPANTEQPYSGDVAWKFETGNSGGLSVGGIKPPVDASTAEVFAFSLFGGPGTDGADVAVVLNDDWANMVKVKLAEGKWTSYEIPLADFGTVDMTAITRFAFKVEGMPASTIYADRVGFDMASGPKALASVIYDDAAANSFEARGGWSATSDFSSTEKVRGGESAIKVNYTGNWGGGAQFIIAEGASALSTEGATKFAFSMYGGEGTGGKEVKLLIKSPEGELTKMIPVVEGEWTDVEVSLEELGGPSAISEMFFQNAEWAGVVHYDHIGLR